jgi:hypothetical protein
VAAAQIGQVTLASAVTANGGQQLGILADESITAVTVTSPAWAYAPLGGPDQGMDDFRVKVV